MDKKTSAHWTVLVLALFFVPISASANYFTLPTDVGIPGNITGYFDHKRNHSDEKYYNGDDGTLLEYDEHNGTDFDGDFGDDIVAPIDGELKDVYWNNLGGWTMHIWHSDIELSTLYAHLATTTIATTSDTVSRYEHIAEMDSTGSASEGSHLHFGVIKGESLSDKRIDPYGWRGAGTDPWSHNQGYLWTTDEPSFALISTTTGTISSDTTWRGNILVDGTVTINSGVTLTIDGAIVKFKDSTSKIVVNGTLDANGTPGATSSLVYFTSNKDDVGADTNYDGSATSPAAGDWRSIEVGSGGTATFDHAIIRYGGNQTSSGSQANVYNNGGTVTMTDATSTDSWNYDLRNDSGTSTCTRCELSHAWTAVYHTGGSTTIDDSYIHDNAYFGTFGHGTGVLTVDDSVFANHDVYGAGYVGFHHGLTFNHSGNTSTGVAGSLDSNLHGFLTNGYVNESVTWQADNIPYIIYPYLISTDVYGTRVPGSATLTINPGAVVKFASTTDGQAYLNTSGTISAIGTTQNPIYFTSLKDDTVGGDTNADGAATSPNRGDWLGLLVGPFGAGGSGVFEYVVARYGGGIEASTLTNYGLIKNQSGTVTIASSTIAESGYVGVWQSTSDGSTTVHTSNLTGVDYYYGMYSNETGGSDAEYNYWGASDGPQPGGSGVWVYGVDADPYASSQVSW